MDVEKQAGSELQKLGEMIGDIKFAMLTTVEEDGTPRSRPMQTLQMDAQGRLWFFTGISSPKVQEAMEHRKVCIAYARPDKQEFVSVSGSARVVRDRAKMEALYTPFLKPWFPKGLDDPDLVLLAVQIEDAEYWDSPGNVAARYFGLAKAIATGDKDALGENAKIHVGPGSV